MSQSRSGGAGGFGALFRCRAGRPEIRKKGSTTLAGPSEAGAGTPAAGDRKRTGEAEAACPPALDAETLAELAGIGCTRAEAAAWFGIPLAELGRRLRESALKEAWKQGAARGRVRVRRAQFALAERNATMATTLGRLMLGQGGGTGAAAPKKITLVVDTGIERDEED